MPKVAFYTLGCKVNQYESDAMAELFKKRGYELVDFDDVADVYVINTCTVTNEGARKSRQIIRQAIRKNPEAKVAVVGCYAQLEAEEVSCIPGVDVVVGTKDRHKIVDLVEQAGKNDGKIIEVEDIMHTKNFEEIAFRGHRQRTRAFLKIQEGCNMFCSYCIIPYVRGPVRSRTLEGIIREAENLAGDGFQEIVLTGIHLGLYGADFKGGPTLYDVIERLSRIEGVKRIRLSSIEAMELNNDFIKKLASIDSFCHHFHIPLQSGSDRILKLMNRRYTTAEFEERLQFIRDVMPNVGITTDVIVGFPGETDEDFEMTRELIKRSGFSRLHVFKFSPRKGTPAAEMPEQVPAAVKELRSRELIKLSRRLEWNFREGFTGRVMDVLFEERDSRGLYHGLTGNYIRVAVRSDLDLRNLLLPVRLVENRDEYILGETKKF
ncbi:tRNA (N(6)-L-threonylcarbamoyladenosine(37)-C(2))-methylthiotransferase MtaB [Thermosediminibacter litoriperuensis]|uniref:Threonylcarbamoyladenosine tRNA methylthiotransferase MtaB n=1 Tax=Thermosediminibacter litoriperuensis TaxID=291989 RepID=A0A5S5ASG1_9FIRM|nr:tRNA (N(6)-L-threonylcarbamoyladenosine(37)-C(2))-methylthiotransferase MtaB [Thermosediminibacter litoriperuensis]TYP54980.1 threonylcarbamoyladenosine tRNA methylthiotransferase MtaB [Thermosediminibacter litoriperuensis]